MSSSIRGKQRERLQAPLDESQATEAISEMEDEYQADFIEDLDDAKPQTSSATWTPTTLSTSSATSPTKAEALLRLMGWKTPPRFADFWGTRTAPQAA